MGWSDCTQGICMLLFWGRKNSQQNNVDRNAASDRQIKTYPTINMPNLLQKPSDSELQRDRTNEAKVHNDDDEIQKDEVVEDKHNHVEMTSQSPQHRCGSQNLMITYREIDSDQYTIESNMDDDDTVLLSLTTPKLMKQNGGKDVSILNRIEYSNNIHPLMIAKSEIIVNKTTTLTDEDNPQAEIFNKTPRMMTMMSRALKKLPTRNNLLSLQSSMRQSMPSKHLSTIIIQPTISSAPPILIKDNYYYYNFLMNSSTFKPSIRDKLMTEVLQPTTEQTKMLYRDLQIELESQLDCDINQRVDRPRLNYQTANKLGNNNIDSKSWLKAARLLSKPLDKSAYFILRIRKRHRSRTTTKLGFKQNRNNRLGRRLTKSLSCIRKQIQLPYGKMYDFCQNTSILPTTTIKPTTELKNRTHQISQESLSQRINTPEKLVKMYATAAYRLYTYPNTGDDDNLDELIIWTWDENMNEGEESKRNQDDNEDNKNNSSSNNNNNTNNNNEKNNLFSNPVSTLTRKLSKATTINSHHVDQNQPAIIMNNVQNKLKKYLSLTDLILHGIDWKGDLLISRGLHVRNIFEQDEEQFLDQLIILKRLELLTQLEEYKSTRYYYIRCQQNDLNDFIPQKSVDRIGKSSSKFTHRQRCDHQIPLNLKSSYSNLPPVIINKSIEQKQKNMKDVIHSIKNSDHLQHTPPHSIYTQKKNILPSKRILYKMRSLNKIIPIDNGNALLEYSEVNTNNADTKLITILPSINDDKKLKVTGKKTSKHLKYPRK
ncbi:unnamed protein product [Trichobilharzia szidati]|nr:unnamed protein product [Trichobilharzia szidati]